VAMAQKNSSKVVAVPTGNQGLLVADWAAQGRWCGRYSALQLYDLDGWERAIDG